MDAEELAHDLAAVLPGLARRTLVLAAPTARPPPPGAWAPGCFSVQIVLRGGIDLAVPSDDGLEWTRVDRRHLLAVCPGSWSPRSRATARSHLAFGFGGAIELARFDTPAGGGGQGPSLHVRIEPPPLLAQLQAAVLACATRAPRAELLQPLLQGLLPLVLDALRQAGPAADRLTEIRAWLRAHCCEPLQRDAVAARFGIGGDHLGRLLRASGGASFVELLQRYRLEHACELLRDEPIGLEAVAARCGLGSATWLIRLFRRRYGMTPAAWRAAWRSRATQTGD